jgi:acyl-CoA thioester hydrolase
VTEYFRHLGWPYRDLVEAGTDPSVVSAQITFAKPAHFEDVIDVDVRCVRVGRSSFGLNMMMLRGDEAVATMEMVYVNVDPSSATSRALPEDVAEALRTETDIPLSAPSPES